MKEMLTCFMTLEAPGAFSDCFDQASPDVFVSFLAATDLVELGASKCLCFALSLASDSRTGALGPNPGSESWDSRAHPANVYPACCMSGARGCGTDRNKRVLQAQTLRML